MYKPHRGGSDGGWKKKKDFGGARSFGAKKSFGGAKKSFGAPRGGDSSDGMHDAVCHACGNPCKVPFRPYPGKAMFCSACFKRGEEGGERPSRPSFTDKRTPGAFGGRPSAEGSNVEKRLARIEEKLDALIEALTENAEMIDDDDEEDEEDEEDVEQAPVAQTPA